MKIPSSKEEFAVTTSTGCGSDGMEVWVDQKKEPTTAKDYIKVIIIIIVVLFVLYELWHEFLKPRKSLPSGHSTLVPHKSIKLVGPHDTVGLKKIIPLKGPY